MKRILLILTFLGALLSLSAQSTRVKFNVEFDPQSVWFSSDDASVKPDGAIIHLHAGLNMDYYFSEKYAFVLGVGINNLGGNLLYADSTEFNSKGESLWIEQGQSVKLNLQYIDIPIGLKLKTDEMGYATYFLQLGFNPMINLNAKASSEEASLEKEDIKESINTFYLGYHVGIGIEYNLGGSTSLIGGIRWSSGFTDVTNNDRANITLNSISLHLGVLF
jgi:hypothetical protein